MEEKYMLFTKMFSICFPFIQNSLNRPQARNRETTLSFDRNTLILKKEWYFHDRVHIMNRASKSFLLAFLICLFATTQSNAQSHLAGFVASPYLNEQVKTIEFSPEVRIQINAPAEEKFIPTGPTSLILYALPNGNTIEQTAGRRMSDGLDWHFNIQHIGAQTRRLREIMPGENIVIVYLEAGGKSWPQWRRKFANSNELIARIVDTVRNELRSFNPKVILTGHSGGGSFVFGFLDGVETIPEYVTRISFLDSNYGYEDSSRHGDKLIEWLHRNPNFVLSVIAYDDRNIVLNGKRVVGPDGGTFRATHRMIDGLQKEIHFSFRQDSAIQRYAGLNNQIEFLIHTNPDTLILHTILVEKNGFLHGMTAGSPQEKDAGIFFGPTDYEKWIQP
jgi:hypothetical protein